MLPTVVSTEEAEKQSQKESEGGANGAPGLDMLEMGDTGGEMRFQLVRIWQRIRLPLEAHEVNARGGNEEIWALLEFEQFDPDLDGPMLAPPKRHKQWKKFDSETELSDFIRKDTGEPLTVPPYSLTPQQSSKIEEDAKKSIDQITEDFRRFRVKSEMARKQADAQIRELQSSNVESAKQSRKSWNRRGRNIRAWNDSALK